MSEITLQQDVLLAGSRVTEARTLVDILVATAQSHPDALALEDADGALTYRSLLGIVNERAVGLVESGVRRGDKVGIRIPSGGRDLYISILATLVAGAAYVPVDADDPEDRARLVFGEAHVVGVIGVGGVFVTRDVVDADALADRPIPDGFAPDLLTVGGTGVIATVSAPRTTDDAWVIFTSGSTGVPKGVAVSHRSAAAFVDAEAQLFLAGDPIAPGDRVLAGLSVAFDASCEEMWLAWRNGACLVPAPRSLVRSGVDLGPWLIAHGITIVSTVPTLASLWPEESLELVRLLIFGGEACPPELVARISARGREVWNTYGPTEATVVACASLLGGPGPVRIGLPLDGWDLAVVNDRGEPVGEGESGELIIGGVGLARYLDPAKDAEKYAPMPSLGPGWERAYRSGDLVRFEPEGLVFLGRADDQIKIGGRRIELGEIEAALRALNGVADAAAVVQTSAAGNKLLVGYITLTDGAEFDRAAANDAIRDELPAAMVPLLAVVDAMPTRTSGKVDRSALPWPLVGAADGEGAGAGLTPTAEWLAEKWTAILGSPVAGPDEDFFASGGGSLTAAQLVSAIRERYPDTRVSDIYDQPRIGALADELDSRVPIASARERSVLPTPLGSRIAQTLLGIPLHVLVGLKWLVYLAAANNLLTAWADVTFAPTVNWWWIVAGYLLIITPLGKMAISVVAARLLLRGVEPGNYPRGGSVHLRLWLAEQVALLVDPASLAGAPWISYYARALGAKIGQGVDLHSLPPVTGMLTIGARAAIEPETDLAGYWIDGDQLRLGAVHIGADSKIGSRSTLLGGTDIGRGSEIEPGSAVSGSVPDGERWAGSPATRVGSARRPWPAERPPSARRWLVAYALGSVGASAVPALSVIVGLLVVAATIGDASEFGQTVLRAALGVPLAVIAAGIVYAVLVIAVVRLLGLGLAEGHFPVRSRIGWQVWMTERMLDATRTLLFPVYASLITPLWLRLLGATVGANVEASTVLLIPKLTTIAPGAFLADDTMVATYELGGGWVHIGRAKIGRRAFLGNSGMTGPGRSVPRNALVAVLSATPRKAKRGSSWLGNPPVRLRRTATESDEARTFLPPLRLRVARALWEILRIVPVMVSAWIGLGVLASLELLWIAIGPWWALALSGVMMLAAGAVAAGVTTVAKWAFVGRIAESEHPLWSSFIWRNEVQDTFVEMVARPWFAQAATGTPALAFWLRTLGAKVGSGVWCESYWLPEADLVTLADGATINRGCVVQTHLFHDRIMQLDTVALGAGSTLGPHSVILPAASIDADATVGAASLVMRGERVPAGSLWSGNPIAPWRSPPWNT